jgi:hypothetical protein
VIPGKMRLEYPAGKMLYETSGWVSPPPRLTGWRLHRFQSTIRRPATDGGSIAEVDGAGKVRKLSEPFRFGLRTRLVATRRWSGSRRRASAANRALFSTTRLGKSGSVYSHPRVVDDRGLLPGWEAAHDVRHGTRMEIRVLAPGETKERDLTWLDWSLPLPSRRHGLSGGVAPKRREAAGAGYSVYIRKHRRISGEFGLEREARSESLSPDGQLGARGCGHRQLADPQLRSR